MEARVPPREFLNDDNVRTVPDVVDFTTFGEITPAIQERPPRTVYDSRVKMQTKDNAHTWSI
jgi:hypothetical protein